ncbi:hypothetical protein SAMN02799624_06203 [Paenibacillus sp. UNC496MF]|uniref:hypothetical protein n=1 Tax=Paenibacillus sp. UNC496MF TaxID=1502753 RepID=UPI0008EEBEA5|nr:hypothetical protein [Paenibacillus sp. UNC496MF]SFJ83545.1 hypothetical protein SAMN02799624_06203 [Paenibacillus sp. UNC496MF]
MKLTESDYAALHQDPQSQADGNRAASGGTESPDGAAHASGWFSFFTLGRGHILGGYEHLLFLFSLLIARQTFKQYPNIYDRAHRWKCSRRAVTAGSAIALILGAYW